eukprot:gnl/TRDRNA2_/TRDRNA2_71848_c0_seq1.p1 gnl/TRDRNA2_/TRDRNA2_71848_c0~~gnl/TRDRNA2_/TRDRNA2_71848_c0_seq1.p1  ORF type:complete len:262 (-),score=25.77 gnl/TRDRNA2_/TRDRNA2_71848_c0_seq1:861-1646(-)
MIHPMYLEGSVPFHCEDRWHYSPGCMCGKGACIPVVLANYEWNVREWAHVAKSLHLPLAITWLGWFGDFHAMFDLFSKGHNLLFYWYRPDSPFRSLSLAPKMVLFNEAGPVVRQSQSTLKIVWLGLHNVAPDIYSFLVKATFGDADFKAMMVRVGSCADPCTTACDWLRDPVKTKQMGELAAGVTSCSKRVGLVDQFGMFVTNRSLAASCALCRIGHYSKPLTDDSGTTHVCQLRTWILPSRQWEDCLSKVQERGVPAFTW